MTSKTIYNPIIKNKVTFLNSVLLKNEGTTKIEVELQSFGGYNPIRTAQNKTIEVKTGRLDVIVNHKRQVLFANQRITILKNSFYFIENLGPVKASFIEEIFPGCSKLEMFLKINYGLVADGLTNNNCIPKNILHSAVLNKFNEAFLPKNKRIYKSSFLLNLLGRYAKFSGIEKSLYQRYVRC